MKVVANSVGFFLFILALIYFGFIWFGGDLQSYSLEDLNWVNHQPSITKNGNNFSANY